MQTVRYNRVPSTVDFGRVCWAWDDIWLDSRRETEAAKYYRAKYGVPISQRVLDAVQEEGFCSLASLRKQLDELPPRADDVAAPIDLNQQAGAGTGAAPFTGGPPPVSSPQQQAQATLAAAPPPVLDQLLEAARKGQSPFPGIDPVTAVAIIESAYRARGLTPPWPMSWKVGLGVGVAAVVGILGYSFLRRR